MRIRQLRWVASFGVLPAMTMASTLYLNNYGGSGSSSTQLPSSAGYFDTIAGLFPPGTVYPADCAFSLKASGLSSDCTTKYAPSADPPFNLLTDAQHGILQLADPKNPSAPAVFRTTDPVITFELKMSYDHNVLSEASKNQAQYYQTDVNDFRLGYGFIAVTSNNSPANLCLGITANKIIAFVDGPAQDPEQQIQPDYFYVGLKEIADYSPGTIVDVKIQIDKIKKTGTYFINGEKKLTINLAGKLPDTDQLTVVKTSSPRPSSGNSLDGWSFVWTPVKPDLNFGSLGVPELGDSRYTAGGLLDTQLQSTIFTIFSGVPTFETFPEQYLYPYGSWVAPGQFAFDTEYNLTFKRLKVSTRSQD